MSEALVNPELVRWARERSHFALDSFAKKIGTKAEKVGSWETGESRPTFRQAQRIAQVARIPFGFLFLPTPPEEPLPIPDLRTLGNAPRGEVSPELRDLLLDIRFKQDWYADQLRAQGGEPLPFLGRYAPGKLIRHFETVARDIAATLGLDEGLRAGAHNTEDFLRDLVRAAEQVGIWVMRSGTVGGNTHRTLSVSEFRGLAVSDPFVPVIFINGRDAKAAQVFTFAHELAHLWIGQSGISNPDLDRPSRQAETVTEVFCNKVAAEFLVPADALGALWPDGADVADSAHLFAQQFKVSSVVIARRAFDLGLTTWDEYHGFYVRESEKWERQRAAQAGGGGDYYTTAKWRNGSVFTETVVASALSGKLLLRDAGRLLNMNPANVRRMGRELGIT